MWGMGAKAHIQTQTNERYDKVYFRSLGSLMFLYDLLSFYYAFRMMIFLLL